MQRNVPFTSFCLCGLRSSAVLAQDERQDPLHDASDAHEARYRDSDTAVDNLRRQRFDQNMGAR